MNYKEIFDQRGAHYNKAHLIAPDARIPERDAMLKWLVPEAGETIAVVAAGGGFDAVGIEAFLSPRKARIVCIEPSPIFSEFIPKHMEIHNTTLDAIPMHDGSADAILNLAALHHVENREAVFAEWMRVLRPGGRIVVGDVMQGSGNAGFLNDTVNRYTPGGHEGVFLEPGYLSCLLNSYGLVNVEESLERYTWNFENTEEMLQFSKLIFGMVKAGDSDILDGIKKYLNPLYNHRSRSVSYDWSLLFFKGYKPT